MSQVELIRKLKIWQRWRFDSGVRLGFKPEASHLRNMPRETRIPDPGIDLECEIINRAYEETLLKIHKLVIWIEYLSDYKSEREKAAHYGKSRRTYRKDRDDAHKHLAQILESELAQV